MNCTVPFDHEAYTTSDMHVAGLTLHIWGLLQHAHPLNRTQEKVSEHEAGLASTACMVLTWRLSWQISPGFC